MTCLQDLIKTGGTDMKKIALIIALVFSLMGCATTHKTSSHIDKTRYKRVGVLVTRMGNEVYSGVSPIILQTNYTNRRSVTQPYLALSEKFVDVYIEEEGRLKESIPNYPKYKSSAGENIGPLYKASQYYFKNITPQLFAHVSQLLTEKGYEVVNLRQVSKDWNKPISEMTVDEIIEKSRGVVDAIFIFHYMDVGDSFQSLNAVSTSYVQTKGFGFLSYTVAMFDVATKERILSFRPAWPYRISAVLVNDPEILADPALKQKVSNVGGLEKTTFSDEEIVERVAKYICYGVKWKSSDGNQQEWKGLNVIVP